MSDATPAGSQSSDHRFIVNVGWSFVAAFVPSAATFIGTIFVARQLGGQGFGRFSLIQTTVLAFGLYAPVALGTTSAKYIAEVVATNRQLARHIRQALFRLSLYIGIGCGLLVASLSPILSHAAFGDATLVRPIQIASLGLLVLGLLATLTGSLSGYGRFRAVAVVGSVRGCMTAIGLAAGAKLGGLDGAMAGLVLAWSAALLTAAIFLRRVETKTAPLAADVPRPATRSLLIGFSLPVFLAPAAFLLVNAAIGYHLARSPGGALEVATWNAAMQLRLLLLFLPTTLTTPLLVSVSAAKGQDCAGTSKHDIRLSVLVTVLSVGVPAAVILANANSVLAIFGPAFVGTSTVVVRVLAATVVSTLPLLIETLLRGAGYAWKAASITFIWSALMLGGLLVLDASNAAATAGLLLWSYGSVIPLSLYLWHRLPRTVSSPSFRTVSPRVPKEGPVT